MKISKNFAKIDAKHDKMVAHTLEEAINLLKDLKFAMFDESVEETIRKHYKIIKS